MADDHARKAVPRTGVMPDLVWSHDWAATSLGPLARWPQSLRTAVDIVLAMPGPATLLWGSDHVQIYNDAYIAIARNRHPDLLGCPVATGWSDAYDTVIAPLIHAAYCGRSTHLSDVLVPLTGSGWQLEERRFDTDWSPIRDDRGVVAGVLQTLVETTGRLTAEAALLESEARHRLLIGTWAQAVWETDANGRVTVDSPTWRAWTGQTLAECLGYGWLDAVHPDDRAYAAQQWREAIDARTVVDAEFRLRGPDGAWRWTNVRAAPVLDQAGGILKWAGMNIDIDPRKRAEAALRESEERLRSFGEASSDVLWIRDADTLRWTYLTPAFEEIYGLARETALAGDDFQNWVDLILPKDRPNAVKMIEQVREGKKVTFEYRVERPSDGTVRWLRNTDFPIRDGDGRVISIGGIGRDVTQEKDTDRAIRASRRQLRTLVEGMAQLVWRAVGCGRWIWASPQWTAYTGLSSQASMGAGWLAALHPDDRAQAMEAWRQTAETGDHLDVEYRVLGTKRNEYRWFQTRAAPVRDEDTGVILEWLGTSTDIDELRQMQEEQTVMVAELQHRTRNLITVVSSIARQTMADTGPSEAFQVELKRRLDALSRVQSLLLRAGEDPISIGQVVEMELEAFGASRAGERTLVSGPEVRLRKSMVQTLTLAIHELATNARKYGALANGHGRLIVRWTTRRAEGEGHRLFFEWIERGVPSLSVPSAPMAQGSGYGRQLIEKALPYSLGARTTYEVKTDGLHCTIDLPLSET